MMEWTSSFKLGIRVKCLRCASCCKHVRYGVGLMHTDYMRIRGTIRGIRFAKPVSHPVFSFNLNSPQSKCIFLNGKNCSIYEARPLLCHLYPFQVGIRHDGKLLLCLNRCPGVNLNDGELVDESYIEDEILGKILRLGSKVFIEKLRDYFLRIKMRVTPLLHTTSGVFYSHWEAKCLLEEMILNLLQSSSLSDLTPWERLWCIYYGGLPLFSSQIFNQTGTLVTEQDVLLSYESVKNQLDIALAESATLRKRLREELEMDFTVQTGDVLKAIPISEDAVRKEIDYLKEIVRREGMYGAVVYDLSVDMEIFLLLRVAYALELYANAFTVKKMGNHVGASEIAVAIRCVDGSLTDIAASIIVRGL